MYRSRKKELDSICDSLISASESAWALAHQLRERPFDRVVVADAAETIARSTERQAHRLRMLIR